MIRCSRARLAALATAALLTAAAVVATAAPAQAVTFDDEAVHFTAHLTVAGQPYTLRDVSVGTARRTVHIGQHSGPYRSHYRLTLKDAAGHVLAKVDRGLEKQAYVLAVLADEAFPTVQAFRAAEHRALHVSAAVAKRHWLKSLRIESVGADLESNIVATSDYLDALPAGAAPDFSAVRSIHSDEYRGSVTISGSDAHHWSVIVRSTQDGYGEFFDETTGGEGSFRF